MFILPLAVNPWRWWSGIVYVVYLIISLHVCVQALQFSEALSIIELQRVLIEMEDFLLNKNSHRDPLGSLRFNLRKGSPEPEVFHPGTRWFQLTWKLWLNYDAADDDGDDEDDGYDDGDDDGAAAAADDDDDDDGDDDDGDDDGGGDDDGDGDDDAADDDDGDGDGDDDDDGDDDGDGDGDDAAAADDDDDDGDDDDDDDMSNRLRYSWSKILAKVILSNLHPNIGHLSCVCDIALCQFVLLEFILTHSCSIDRSNLS